MFALLLALPTTSQWENYLLFRNKKSFGVADPQFGADVGFYLFELPFLSFVLDWLFIAVLVTLVLTAGDARAQRRRGLRLTGAVDPQRQQGPHRRAAGGARRAQGR